MSQVTRRTFLGAAAAIAVAPAAAGELAVEEVAAGVFVHRGRHELASRDNLGDIANVGFVVGDEAVAVIDTGGGPTVGERLKAAVASVTDRPVRWVINSHMHPDHVFGNGAFRDMSAVVVGHANLPAQLVARGDSYMRRLEEDLGPEEARRAWLIPPAETVETGLTLDLGGRTLELTAQPTAHTNNDLTVYDPKTGILWLADLLFMERMPSLDGSALGWLALMDRLAAQRVERVVPGHGPASAAWPDAVAPQRRYWQAVVDGIRTLRRSGGTIEQAMAEVALDERPHWLLFDDYHQRNIALAFAELEWE